MRRVFYSFHYAKDSMRVMTIRNMGIFEGNEPVEKNKWEEIKRKGDSAISQWIDKTMKPCDCVIVLIGEKTASRHWVKYEIEHAWATGKGLMGIYIHNIDPVNDNLAKPGEKGKNPFSCFQLSPMRLILLGNTQPPINLDKVVPIKDPKSKDAFNDIKSNLSSWVEEAIKIRETYLQMEIRKTQAESIFGESLEDKD